MAFSTFSNVRLAALSAVVPRDAVRIEDELRYFGGDLEQAKRLTRVSGLDIRRKAPEGVTASDLCASAAERLFRETGVDRSSIGAVLFVSHSPDYPLPASASILQHRLGLSTECAALDMNVGCAGFVHGFWMASGLVQSGACATVLLLVGDTPARFADPDNRTVAPVFGDAGTAALIVHEPGKDAGSLSFLLANNGARNEALIIPGGGSRIPYRADEGPDAPFNATVKDAKGNPWGMGGYCTIWMDGMSIYSFGVTTVPPHIAEHLARRGMEAESLDALFLHQANKIMVETIGRKCGLPPAKVPFETMPLYGNLASSSIPALLCAHYAKGGAGAKNETGAKDGAGVNEARGTVMLCAFGAGLAISSCILSLEKTRFLPVGEFTADADSPARDDLIAYWHGKFAE